MKLSEVQEYLSQFRKSVTSAKGVGCYKEVIIKTRNFGSQDGETVVCETDKLVETHYNQILEVINNHPDDVVYVRTSPRIVDHMDEEGETEGKYGMRTRLQFGKPDLCITIEQYANLLELGWMTP